MRERLAAIHSFSCGTKKLGARRLRVELLQGRSHQVHGSGNHQSPPTLTRKIYGFPHAGSGGDFSSHVTSDFANLFWRCCAWAICLRGDNFLGKRKKDLRDLPDRLVTHCTEDDGEGCAVVARRKRRAQRPCSRRIMSHVQHNLWRAGDYLEASCPDCLSDALADVLRRDTVSKALIQFHRGCDCQRDSAQLVPSRKRRIDRNLLAQHFYRISIMW